ncbi:MAG: valine--tRNA ligase [Candidatus Omnitrophica bacterium]|nr:valine--tRNA ligase [Candidatus Omnitrophota bacterium]
MDEIPKQYSPSDTEERWYSFWEENNLFSAKVNHEKKPFTILIPPPNITGILHMGHALNNTLQDILVRYSRMRGLESLWMPGTDHAGIATQNVVEKAIAKEGFKRQDLGRDKFIERVWRWQEEYGSTIIRQLKKLGASCDWQRLRFTMDEEYSKAVVEVFLRLYEKGLIYRGTYIINWCPRCHTALSDEEAAHREIKGSLYYLRYPLEQANRQTGKQANYIVVATTRPETMLGDTAVAVNPKDKRYKNIIGKTITLPLVNRRIKIIADSIVDIKFGTGAVKVTPAHDPNDYALGKKHRLDFINVLNPDATMSELAGPYKGLERFKAREKIVEDLKALGLLEKIEPHDLSAGHCYRCHTIVEPYLSKQWFVKMGPLAKSAIKVVKEGKIKFYPNRWTKVYLNWMENIQDWCISRQIWWGHRIPVYYCGSCKEGDGVIVSRIKPEKCPKCNSSDIHQDEDVLDTWFSSWLWPFATFYRKDDLAYFYPTSTLVTAPEIIFFWVARMIMAGMEFQNKIPFKDVYIHGTVRDAEGKKMSKSLGNSIDPLEVIKEYGADALRFSIISITAQGQDVFLSKEKFEQGRNFANKVWNASRFILINLVFEKVNFDLCVFFKKEALSPVNRWILSRFFSILSEVEKCLEKYRFNEAANLLYGFFWHEFCDWYLEIIKSDIQNPHNQLIMYKVLEKSLRAMHPFMPFITEEIWQKLPHEGLSIMVSKWPHIQKQIIDKEIEKEMAEVFEVVSAIRNMRLALDIPLASLDIQVKIYPANKNNRLLLESNASYIKSLAKVKSLAIEDKFLHLKNEYVNVLKGMHITIPLTGIIDIDKYLKKINDKILGAEIDIKSKKAMLNNKNFIQRAPKEIIEAEKNKLEALNEEAKKLRGLRDGLKA